MSGEHDEYMAGLVAEVLDDAGESMAEAMNLTLALKDGADREAVYEIYRVLHSLKGHCAILGFFALKALAHAMEDLFERQRSGAAAPLAPATLDLCLKGYDAAAVILSRIRAGEPETAAAGEFDALIETMKKLL